jgi:hypothetical protein
MKTHPRNLTVRDLAASELEAVAGGTTDETVSNGPGGGTVSHTNPPQNDVSHYTCGTSDDGASLHCTRE